MNAGALRLEAWRVLEGQSAALDAARDVSRILREAQIRGAVIEILTDEQIGRPPRRISTIQRIQTVGLADLINMKLRSGTKSVLRAQHLADAIALIRTCRLNGTFAARIDRPLRANFTRLHSAVRKEEPRRPCAHSADAGTRATSWSACAARASASRSAFSRSRGTSRSERPQTTAR